MGDAIELYRAVHDRYQTVPVFRDRGTVEMVFHCEKPMAQRHYSCRDFATAFRRDELRIRFEYWEHVDGPSEAWPLYVMWGDSKRARSYRSVTERYEEDETSLVLAGMHGVSGGVSGRVPWMLIADELQSSEDPEARREPTVEFGEERIVEGVRCVELVGAEAGGGSWLVDPDSLLIRMVEEEIDLGSREAVEDGIADLERIILAEGFDADELREHLDRRRAKLHNCQPNIVRTTTSIWPEIPDFITDDELVYVPGRD